MAATTLLFDVDGTLWNSYPWYAEVLSELSGYGADTVCDKLLAGRSIVTLVKECGISDVAFRKACSKSIGDLELYPSVADTLRELARRRIRCGVVTSLPGRIVEPILAETALSKAFAVIVHAGSVRPQKPNPAPLLHALKLLDAISNDGTFYVGDRSSDALAARRAGVQFAWAAYGYETERPQGTAAVLREFSEVLSL